MSDEPVAIAVVRDARERVLCLLGWWRLDLPGVTVLPGESPLTAMKRRLGGLGVRPIALRYAWVGMAPSKGRPVPRMVHGIAVDRWEGEPSAQTNWIEEEKFLKLGRDEVYARLFAKIREGSRSATG